MSAAYGTSIREADLVEIDGNGLPERVDALREAHDTRASAIHVEDWQPMHSMHTPDEVRKTLSELQSVKSAMQKAKKKVRRGPVRRTVDVRQQYEEDLLPALTSVADDGRMLFIQVST